VEGGGILEVVDVVEGGGILEVVDVVEGDGILEIIDIIGDDIKKVDDIVEVSNGEDTTGVREDTIGIGEDMIEIGEDTTGVKDGKNSVVELNGNNVLSSPLPSSVEDGDTIIDLVKTMSIDNVDDSNSSPDPSSSIDVFIESAVISSHSNTKMKTEAFPSIAYHVKSIQ
jgi:hypothetical protein